MTIEELYADKSTHELRQAESKLSGNVEKTLASMQASHLLKVRALLDSEDYVGLTEDEFGTLRMSLHLTAQQFTLELLRKEIFRREMDNDDEDGGRKVRLDNPDIGPTYTAKDLVECT